MSIQEGIIFSWYGLLIANDDQNLEDVQTPKNDLDWHDREVNIIAVLQDICDRHIRVQLAFKSLIHYGQDQLQDKINDQDCYDELFGLFIGTLTRSESFACEPFNAEAIAKTVIQLANFVHHGLFDQVSELLLLLAGQVAAIFVDLVTKVLTFLHESVRALLVITVLHDCLYSNEKKKVRRER